MKGSGYYNLNSSVQSGVIERQKSQIYRVAKAAASALNPLPRVFNIADLGGAATQLLPGPDPGVMTHEALLRLQVVLKAPTASSLSRSFCKPCPTTLTTAQLMGLLWGGRGCRSWFTTRTSPIRTGSHSLE